MAAKKKTTIKWPSYKGTNQLVGTSSSGRITVYVDPTLGAPALKNAKDLLTSSDNIENANDAIFGTIGSHVDVIVFALGGVTDGTGGADHMGCDYISGSEIEVCASFGSSIRVESLFEAELSECSMNGNLCGVSTGEALSRWCSIIVGNNSLPDYATAPTWAAKGMPDYVNQVNPTDQDPVSTGCGIAFISWLLSLKYGIDQIAQAMVSLGDNGTFAETYSKLTSDSKDNAWQKFLNAIQALPNGITTDDPFNGAPNPSEIVQGLLQKPKSKKLQKEGAYCSPKSKRLLPTLKIEI